METNAQPSRAIGSTDRGDTGASDPTAFRPRFGPFFWVRVGGLLLSFGLVATSVAHGHPGQALVWGGLWLVLFGIPILATLTTSWSFGAQELTVRSLLREDEVPYDEINGVEEASSRREPGDHPITVEYGQLASALRPKTVLKLDPRNRAAFLAALRAHVPHLRGGVQIS